MHEPVLIPDYTLLIQMVIFFACYFVMRGLVFGPYLNLLHARQEKMVGLKERALKARERAHKLQADYEAFMKDTRKNIAAWSEEQRRELNEEERGIIAAARTSVSDELTVLRQKITAETDQARKQLAPLVSEYSSLIASKIVGHKVDAARVLAASGKNSAPQNETTVPR